MAFHELVAIAKFANHQTKRTNAIDPQSISHDYSILIDTGPDLRSQALAFGIDKLDAVFTHEHVDHLYGLDDVDVIALVVTIRSVTVTPTH